MEEGEIWENYDSPAHFLTKNDFHGNDAYAAFLTERAKKEIESLRDDYSHFKIVDLSVLYAVLAARNAVKKAGWEKENNIGINIGSSRGATGLFEKYHETFLRSGKAETLSSPSTTLGNISSWVAQDLQSNGPEFSHSVTCSTGLHSVLNAIAWLQAGMADKFLAGGSEAALTPFTIAQMQAMKIYAREELDYPCRALDMDKKMNSMVLGEAAGMLCLHNDPANAVASIIGVGYSTERLKHSASISANATGMQKAMRMAMGDHKPGDIDAVVMHAPGTIKGDRAELNAIEEVFKKDVPAITSNKWKLGHSFAASGILSMELAILMMQHNKFIPVPFIERQQEPHNLNKVLINAVGFGGNAVSILLSKN